MNRVRASGPPFLSSGSFCHKYASAHSSRSWSVAGRRCSLPATMLTRVMSGAVIPAEVAMRGRALVDELYWARGGAS